MMYNTFSYARHLALLAVAKAMGPSLEELKCPKAYEALKATEQYTAVRKEVYELIRTCTIQEKRLLQ